MYYGEIKKCDIANGEGVRVSLLYPDVPTTVPDALIRIRGILHMEKNTQRIQNKK